LNQAQGLHSCAHAETVYQLGEAKDKERWRCENCEGIQKMQRQQSEGFCPASLVGVDASQAHARGSSEEVKYGACQRHLLERHFCEAIIRGEVRALPQALGTGSERHALVTLGQHKTQYGIVRAHMDAWLQALGSYEGETYCLGQVLVALQGTGDKLVRADSDRSLWGSVAQQLYAGLPVEAELSTEARTSLPATRVLHDRLMGFLDAEARAARDEVVRCVRECLADTAEAIGSAAPADSRGACRSAELVQFVAQGALPQVELAVQWVARVASLPLAYWSDETTSKRDQDMHMTRAEFVTQWDRRRFFTNYFSWAVPTLDVLLLINAFANGPRDFMLEVGAGAGLWSGLLRCLGSNVLATDEAPPGNTFTEVQKLDATAAVRSWELRAQTLLLVWPPHLQDMAARALDAFRGPRMVYVGESRGGCTADESFFESLKRNWKLIGFEVIPTWWNCDDRCFFYLRKRKGVARSSTSRCS